MKRSEGSETMKQALVWLSSEVPVSQLLRM